MTVATTEDAADEDDETFTLTLSNPDGATLGDATATGTIEDDDDPPLTARFSDVPQEHDGGEFSFSLGFSEEFDLSYLTLQGNAFDVTNGAIHRAVRQQQGSNQHWTIRVQPSGSDTVTVSLPATTSCSASGAICTDDERKLSNSNSATVAGPVGISVADARVTEDAGAVLAFVVTLTRAASGRVTVDYATSEGSAQAGVDYTAANSTLTFAAGESSKTIEVAVLDDAHYEGEETLTLTLSNPSSGRLTDDEATGTKENRDPLPRALLARFGRTAAVHVVEHLEERLQAPREPGLRGRFAGQHLRRGMEREMALDFLSRLGGASTMRPGRTSRNAAIFMDSGDSRGRSQTRAPVRTPFRRTRRGRGCATATPRRPPALGRSRPRPSSAGAHAGMGGGLLQMGLGSFWTRSHTSPASTPGSTRKPRISGRRWLPQRRRWRGPRTSRPCGGR